MEKLNLEHGKIINPSIFQEKITLKINELVDFSNRRTRKVVSIGSSARPFINTDSADLTILTLSTDLLNLSTNLSGTPNEGDLWELRIIPDLTPRNLSFGVSFISTSVTLPTVTTASTILSLYFEYQKGVINKWALVGLA